LFDNQLLHLLLSNAFFLVLNLFGVVNLLKGSEGSVVARAKEHGLFVRPFQRWFPALPDLWVAYLVGVLPVIDIVHFVLNDILSLILGVVLCFELVDWSRSVHSIMHFNYIIMGVILGCLLHVILTGEPG